MQALWGYKFSITPETTKVRSSYSNMRGPGPWFNTKVPSYQYRKSHYGDKTILQPSYLHNATHYTGKTASLYWIRAQVSANDSQIAPTVCTGVVSLCAADLPNIYADQCLPTIIYHPIPLLVVIQVRSPRCWHPVVQGVDNHDRGSYCQFCYRICICFLCSSWIIHFSRWLVLLSTMQPRDGIPRTGSIFTPWVVSFTDN